MSNPITGCILARNEEQNIAECIESLRNYADEIILVDNGSEDRTSEIARNLDARIIFMPEGRESDLRNAYIEAATHPWILELDADERLCPQPDLSLEDRLSSGTDIFRLPVNNYYGQGKWATFITARLYKKAIAEYRGDVHCSLSFSGKFDFGFLPLTIHHLDALLRERALGKRSVYMANVISQIQNSDYAAQKMRLTNYLGVEYVATGDYERAQECFEAVIRDGGFYHDLATVYLAQLSILRGNDTEALRHVESLIAEPENTETPLVYGKRTRSTLTEDLYQRACVVLGEIFYQAEDFARALFWCEQARQTWPFAAQHEVNLGTILLAMEMENDPEEAVRAAVRRAIEKNPFLRNPVIYQDGATDSIYRFQTSLLQDASKILSQIKESF